MDAFEFMEGRAVDFQANERLNEELDNTNVPDTFKLFDFLNGINHLKTDYDIDDFDAYSAYVVNRFLSYSMDTCLVANMMNMYPQLPDHMQYVFLKGIVRKRKRFNKWIKPDEDDRVATIMKVYKYSQEKAKAVSDLFTDEQVVILKESLNTGGLK